MRKRQIISALTATVMAMGTLPALAMTAAADSTTENAGESAETAAMRAALTDVKKRVKIPEKYDKFDYKTETRYETTFYRFIWYTGELKWNGEVPREEGIVVEYYNGFISSYELFEENSESSKPSFSKLTPEQQEAYAKKYFYMLNPDIKGNVVINRGSREKDLFSKDVTFYIDRVESGIDMPGNGGKIVVDRDTGALRYFELDWWSEAVLPQASERLSVSEVSDIYASRKPLTAYYDMYYRYDKDEQGNTVSVPYVLAVYRPTVSGENEIDAITGKFTEYYADREKYSYTSAYTWGSSNYGDEDAVECGEGSSGSDVIDDEPSLSEAELAALEKENGYISYEQALKIIKEDEFIVFDKQLVPSSNYISSYFDENRNEQPCRKLQFEYTTDDKAKDDIHLSVTLDAYSGKIISFGKRYVYGTAHKERPKLDVISSQALAERAAEHFIGERAAEYRYDEGSLDPEETHDTAEFTRYVNGLPAVFDDMSVKVNSYGEVLGFGHTYHNIEFPEASLVGEQQAYKKLFRDMKPSLYYRGFTDLQLTPHVYLTYEFDEDYRINALTGERITYSGDNYYTHEKKTEEKKEAVLYTDIKGHKYEKEITTLWEYGVRITDSETLNPDGAITAEEFCKLCSSVGMGYDDESLYNNRTYWDEEKEEYITEYDPRYKAKLTLGELSRIYVYSYTGCYEAAKIPGIYASPFENISPDDPYCGFIAIAKAKGLITGKDGRFNADSNISRGQCLKLFYDYIAGDKDMRLDRIVRI